MESWVKFAYLYHVKHNFKFNKLRIRQCSKIYDYSIFNMVINMMSDQMLQSGCFNKKIAEKIDKYVIRL